jgi:hypothetical protein
MLPIPRRSRPEQEEPMQTQEPTFRLDDALASLWFGGDAGWGDAVRTVDPNTAQSAEAMIVAAGLSWTVEQHPLEAVVAHGGEPLRLPVRKHVANVRSDTRAVVGIVGEGYECASAPDSYRRLNRRVDAFRCAGRCLS